MREDHDPEGSEPEGWEAVRYPPRDPSWEGAWDGGPLGDTPVPGWGPGTPFGTPEAARIGLDRNCIEGAQLAFFSHLRPEKRSHKVVAWIGLVAFGLPVVLTLVRVVGTIGSSLLEH